MARPLKIITQHYEYPLQAAGLDLAAHTGAAMATADASRLLVLNRIYLNMTPAAKARCDFARSVAALGGK